MITLIPESLSPVPQGTGESDSGIKVIYVFCVLNHAGCARHQHCVVLRDRYAKHKGQRQCRYYIMHSATQVLTDTEAYWASISDFRYETNSN